MEIKSINNQSFKFFLHYYKEGFFWLFLALSPFLVAISFAIYSKFVRQPPETCFIPIIVTVVASLYRWSVSHWLPRLTLVKYEIGRSEYSYSSYTIKIIFDQMIGPIINGIINWLLYSLFLWLIMEFFIQLLFLIKAFFLRRSSEFFLKTSGEWPCNPS
ncbi:MAG: hypothetical protein D3906_00670 [Candidatus Electrothrix sp. AUS1_2]|nr:hypothetical protein [Candidatus Electrothrix sp. AUS1_2]